MQGHQEEEEEEEAGRGHGPLRSQHAAAAAAAAAVSLWLLLPPLPPPPLWPQLLLLLQSGLGAERSVLMAGAASWGSVTSQPCCDLTAGPRLRGDGSQGACGEALEHSQGSCSPGEGSRSCWAAPSKGWDRVPPGAEPTALPCFPGTVRGAARHSKSPRTAGNHSQGIADLLGCCYQQLRRLKRE